MATESRSPARRNDRRAQGARVEALARDFLQQNGLEPVAANAHYRGGELDLVMRDGDALVFVEVRYRRGAGFGGGAASVDANKCRKLVRAAHQFLAAHREYARVPCRFDVIDASGDPETPTFDWLRDAFRADDV
ncbi:MAG: YraN family protein [Lysobacter sp.]|nr:YraN family protein [Lysobacter sp.]